MKKGKIAGLVLIAAALLATAPKTVHARYAKDAVDAQKSSLAIMIWQGESEAEKEAIRKQEEKEAKEARTKGNPEIAKAALESTATSTANDCARWVMKVLQEYGFKNAPYWSGATYWEAYGDDTHTLDTLAPGMIVIGTGRNSDTEGKGYYYGHIGISVGDIDGDGVMDIRDSQGDGAAGVKITDIDTWISWQTDARLGSTGRESGFVGWLDPNEILN